MTDRTIRPTKPKRAHRAAGSRKVVAAVSAAATAGLMFSMATAKPAWTVESDIQAAPDLAQPSIAAPAARSRIVLPVPTASDGSVVSPTVAPATPQPVQLDPVAATPQVVTKTVVVKRQTKTKSSGSR